MVGRRVANLEQITCASPAYLAHFGDPADLQALAGHRAVNFLSTATGRAIPLEFMVDGKLQTANLPGSVSVTGADMYAASAIAGLGLVQLPRYRVLSQLADGNLRLVLPDLPPPTLPVSVLYPQNRQLSARVRLFADWLQALFASSKP